jgi:hypothetical protein
MIDWRIIIQDTLMITSFVIIVMLVIEFVNVTTKGLLIKKLNNKPFLQIITGTILGMIPGCMGVFTVVSLYTHRLLSFGALVAAMIATSGDEAYFMLALIPDKALLIFAILAVLAVIVGVITDKIIKNRNFAEKHKFSFNLHQEQCIDPSVKVFSIKNFNFHPKRILIVLIILSIAGLSLVGIIGHSHSESLIFTLPNTSGESKIAMTDIESENEHAHHEHSETCDHSQHEHEHEHGPDWVRITILISALVAIIIVIFANDHFIEKHLWQHLIKKHLPKILLWIFGTLIVIAFVLKYTELGVWIYNNMFVILIIALLLGIIPQSGPHLVFLILFIQGTVPFSILLASSIVQDGHGSLPLLAESKKSFVVMKIINILVGLIVGSIGLLFNF